VFFLKIIITGFSGAGKSTLAQNLGKHYNIPVLHMDSLHFEENWKERDKTEFEESVQDFMKNNDSWIIDGNYRRIAPSRFTESDQLIFLNYNRITCLINAIKRYKKYKGKSRPDIAKGCEEKIDKEFFLWLIWKGRTKERQNRLLNQAKNHKNGIVFKNRKELFKYYKSNNIPYNK
jgi:adenylate kinase family enzyme